MCSARLPTPAFEETHTVAGFVVRVVGPALGLIVASAAALFGDFKNPN
jgi:hypothetical protein